ncbi:MAG: M48 family metallopeptidase [Blastocatellia bacterium]|nr:M48 family metallopeptidase [Blastocatellia bacterium]
MRISKHQLSHMKLLTVLLVCGLFLDALAQSNVYDKFRTRERSNKGYLSVEDELKLAAEVHAEMLKKTRLVQNRELTQYIESLGQRLASKSERRDIPWRFFVVDDPSVNAFATLGGYVYVHTGLISATTSEAQLASVVGHEIGHIVGRHGLENVKKSQKFGTLAGIATIAGAVLGGRSGAQIGEMAGGLIAGGYLMKHSREAEREADFLGLYNIRNADYNTGGMIQMFEMLASLNPNQMGSIMSSHPAPRERAANTRREIDQYLRGTDARGRANSAEFQRIKSLVPSPQTNRKVRPRG